MSQAELDVSERYWCVSLAARMNFTMFIYERWLIDCISKMAHIFTAVQQLEVDELNICFVQDKD